MSFFSISRAFELAAQWENRPLQGDSAVFFLMCECAWIKTSTVQLRKPVLLFTLPLVTCVYLYWIQWCAAESKNLTFYSSQLLPQPHFTLRTYLCIRSLAKDQLETWLSDDESRNLFFWLFYMASLDNIKQNFMPTIQFDIWPDDLCLTLSSCPLSHTSCQDSWRI